MGSRPAHVHVDETPWPVLGEWLWVSAEEKFCLFAGDRPCRVRSVSLSLTALSAAMTSYNGYPDPNRNVWHICGVTSKVAVGSWQPALGQEF